MGSDKVKELREKREDRYHTDPKYRSHRNQYFDDDMICNEGVLYIMERRSNFKPMSKHIFDNRLVEMYEQSNNPITPEQQLNCFNSALEETLEDMRSSRWMKWFKGERKNDVYLSKGERKYEKREDYNGNRNYVKTRL